MNTNFGTKNTNTTIILKTLILIVSLLILIVVFVGWICPFASQILANRTIFIVNKLSKEEMDFINIMIANNKIHTPGVVVEKIISFYEVLISYLLGLFALGGFLGYIFIQKSNKSNIKDEVYAMTTSELFSKLTYNKIQELFTNEKNSGGDLYKISNDIENLFSRIEFLEEVINDEDITIKIEASKKSDCRQETKTNKKRRK